jgi:hypothetical protein
LRRGLFGALPSGLIRKGLSYPVRILILGE